MPLPYPCATVIFRGHQSVSEGRPHIHVLASLFLVGPLGNLLEQTGWVARVILLMLLAFSVISWALIFQKLRLFGQINRRTARALQSFRASKGLPEPRMLGTTGSPVEVVYSAGYRELQSQLTGANPHARIKSLNAVTSSMQQASSDEVRKVEKWMPWLATTGSVTPFIGLFGTVWGVMDAFAGLGTAGAASLRAVAPGIAEALVTTAAGLFTAIPAVIAYNHFLHDTRELAARLDNFTLEVAAQVEKRYN